MIRNSTRRIAALLAVSDVGATLVARDQTNILKTIRKPFAHRQELKTGCRRLTVECKSVE